jgi:MraZ protein
MFRSHFRHTLDSKGRVSIPAEYRVELQVDNTTPPIITKGEDCLCLYPYRYWKVYEKRIIDAASFDPDGESLMRLTIAGSSPCPIDRAGRILIPQRLREHAKCEREVVFAGMGYFIQIWNPSSYEEDEARTWARSRDLRRSLAPKMASMGPTGLGGPEEESSSG